MTHDVTVILTCPVPQSVSTMVQRWSECWKGSEPPLAQHSLSRASTLTFALGVMGNSVSTHTHRTKHTSMLEYHSQIRVSPLHPLRSYQIMDVVLHAKFGDSQLSAFKILKWPRNQDAVNSNIRLGPLPPPT